MNNDSKWANEKSSIAQNEDAALKTVMQFFAQELMPYFGIAETVKTIEPTELISLEIKKFLQDFNFSIDDHRWIHFEFQSRNEGKKGLRRFRSYEALASYQHNVEITTYVLYSGNIRNPVTELHEGINTYQVIPIIMRDKNADILIQTLQQKLEQKQTITKDDLVPLTLCSLMDGKMEQKERFMAAYKIISKTENVEQEMIKKIEAMMYAMADKFLNSVELHELKEVIRMTRLGQMLIDDGILEGTEKTKLASARNLIDLLDAETIAERIGLPLEKVLEIKKEFEESQK